MQSYDCQWGNFLFQMRHITKEDEDEEKEKEEEEEGEEKKKAYST